MKTVYLHGSPDFYGSGKVLLEILRIPGNAANAIVIFPHEGPLCKAVRSMGIPVYTINMGALRRKYFTPWGILGRLFLWLHSIYKIRRVIQQEQVNCIYVNSLNIIIGPWLKINKQVKLVWHVHEIIEEPKPLFWLLQQLLKKADKIIAVSNAVQSHWGQQPLSSIIQVLYNGFSNIEKEEKVVADEIASASLKTDSPNLVIGMIARIQPLKGHSYLLDIFQQLVQQKNHTEARNLKLIIAGDAYPGYEYLAEELKKEIKDRQLENYVDYLGYQDDIKTLLEKLDLLIVPSVKPDSLPTVVIEAMFAGKPVVATRQGGCVEMIEENKTGYFIPLDDAAASCKILQQVLADKKRLEETGIAGKKIADKLFSLAAFQQGWLRIMQS